MSSKFLVVDNFATEDPDDSETDDDEQVLDNLFDRVAILT
jgi:hypothetical protein